MTAIALVSFINRYHINELHLFWDTLYIDDIKLITKNETKKKRRTWDFDTTNKNTEIGYMLYIHYQLYKHICMHAES